MKVKVVTNIVDSPMDNKTFENVEGIEIKYNTVSECMMYYIYLDSSFVAVKEEDVIYLKVEEN